MAASVLAAAVLIAALHAGARAATPDLASREGRWVRVLNRAVERLAGRSVSIDATSIQTVGTSRTFRELDVLIKDKSPLPSGTMQFMRRSVICAAGTTRVEQWRLVASNGAVLGGSTTPGVVQRVRWDNEDGMVMRYVCSGVLQR